MSDKTVLYIVKSIVNKKDEDKFNDWYHNKHIPEIVQLSGCELARRFKEIISDDEFVYMATYEFKNEDSFNKYQNSGAKVRLIDDYLNNFSDVSKLKMSSWKQIYP